MKESHREEVIKKSIEAEEQKKRKALERLE